MTENEEKRNAPETISYFVHEGMMARQERHIKRLWILCIIIFLALVGTNAGWIIYEAQFEDVVTVTQDVDTQSSPAYVNGTGEMTVNGESSPKDYKDAQTQNGREYGL